MTNMFIDPTTIIKKTFTVGTDPTEYICVGYAQNSTFCVFGAANNTVDNRFEIKSFKLTEAKFKGLLP